MPTSGSSRRRPGRRGFRHSRRGRRRRTPPSVAARRPPRRGRTASPAPSGRLSARCSRCPPGRPPQRTAPRTLRACATRGRATGGSNGVKTRPRFAVVLGDTSRRDQIRRSRRLERHLAEGFGDRLVAASAERGEALSKMRTASASTARARRGISSSGRPRTTSNRPSSLSSSSRSESNRNASRRSPDDRASRGSTTRHRGTPTNRRSLGS